MKPEPVKSLRLNEADVDALLDRLDGGTAAAEANARRSTRYPLRIRAVVEFPDQNRVVRTAVICRNLSRDGAGFVCGHFVYVGSTCTLKLVSDFNFTANVEARVMRCRYLSGTAGVYEVGVAFKAPIDVALFHQEGAGSRVLLVDTDELQRDLLASLFRKCNAEVEFALTPDAVLEMVSHQSYEMVVINYGMENTDGCALVHRLRESGYMRPVTCVACRPSGAEAHKCRQAEGAVCEPVPLTREGVQTIIGRLRNEPVTSRCADDPEMADLINRFVESLQEEVLTLQRAVTAADFETIGKRSSRVATLADGAGFDAIAEAANELALAARSAQPEAVRTALAEFARLCFAARPARPPERRAVARPASGGRR